MNKINKNIYRLKHKQFSITEKICIIDKISAGKSRKSIIMNLVFLKVGKGDGLKMIKILAKINLKCKYPTRNEKFQESY